MSLHHLMTTYVYTILAEHGQSVQNVVVTGRICIVVATGLAALHVAGHVKQLLIVRSYYVPKACIQDFASFICDGTRHEFRER